MTAANDDDPFCVVRTFPLARRCASTDCRPRPFTRALVRDGSVREYGDGVQVWTCGTCLNEYRIHEPRMS